MFRLCLHVLKGKILPYSLPSVGPEDNHGEQAVRWIFKPYPGGRLSLLSDILAVTFAVEERHHPSTSTKLYCLVTETYRCGQLSHSCYAALSWWESNPRPTDRKSNLCRYTTAPSLDVLIYSNTDLEQVIYHVFNWDKTRNVFRCWTYPRQHIIFQVFGSTQVD